MSTFDTFIATMPDAPTIKSRWLFYDTDTSQDRFEVTVTYKGREIATPYMTGIGHRAMGVRQGFDIQCNQGRHWHRRQQAYFTPEQAAASGLTKPPVPELADVLACLFSDASAAEETHESWCSDYGVDVDSRKGLDTYLACQKMGNQLRRMFGADYEAVAEAAREH